MQKNLENLKEKAAKSFKKLLPNFLVLNAFFWSKHISYKYLICSNFADGFTPSLWDSFFTISSTLSSVGLCLEYIMKFIFFMMLFSLARAAFRDPGYIDKMNKEMPKNILLEKLEKTCVKCNNNWKPPQAIHCEVCQRCVLKGNHNNLISGCIGLKNLKFFSLFVIYSVIYFIIFDMLCIMNLLLWAASMFQESVKSYFDGIDTLIRIIWFVVILMLTVLSINGGKETITDVVNNRIRRTYTRNYYGRPRSRIESVERVFGTNRWAWLLPVAPKSRVNLLELEYSEDQSLKDENGEAIYEEEDGFKKLKAYDKYFVSLS